MKNLITIEAMVTLKDGTVIGPCLFELGRFDRPLSASEAMSTVITQLHEYVQAEWTALQIGDLDVDKATHVMFPTRDIARINICPREETKEEV